MDIGVTGSLGAIGSSIRRNLVALGFRVIELDDDVRGKTDLCNVGHLDWTPKVPLVAGLKLILAGSND